MASGLSLWRGASPVLRTWGFAETRRNPAEPADLRGFSRSPANRGLYPALAGGLWLLRTLVLSGFHAVVVPSGFSVTVQPHRWITT